MQNTELVNRLKNELNLEVALWANYDAQPPVSELPKQEASNNEASQQANPEPSPEQENPSKASSQSFGSRLADGMRRFASFVTGEDLRQDEPEQPAAQEEAHEEPQEEQQENQQEEPEQKAVWVEDTNQGNTQGFYQPKPMNRMETWANNRRQFFNPRQKINPWA